MRAFDLSSPVPISRVFDIETLKRVGWKFGDAQATELTPPQLPTVKIGTGNSQPNKTGKKIARLLADLGISEQVTNDDFYARIKNEPFTDLVIETHGNDIYFTHYREQGGDTFIETEMIFRFDGDGVLNLIETGVLGPTMQDHRSRDPGFADMFAKNLLDQGFNEQAHNMDATIPGKPEPANPLMPKPGEIAPPVIESKSDWGINMDRIGPGMVIENKQGDRREVISLMLTGDSLNVRKADGWNEYISDLSNWRLVEVDGPASDKLVEMRSYNFNDPAERRAALTEVFNYPEDIADMELEILDSIAGVWAQRFKEQPENFWKWLDSVQGPPPAGAEGMTEALQQQRRGMYSMLEGGKRMIGAFQDGDADTWLHESAHYFFDFALTERDRSEVQRLLGLESLTGDDYASAQETFAEGYVKYRIDGVAPSSKMAVLFAKFQVYMVTLFDRLAQKFGLDIGDLVGPSYDPEMRDIYHRMIRPEPWETPVTDWMGQEHTVEWHGQKSVYYPFMWKHGSEAQQPLEFPGRLGKEEVIRLAHETYVARAAVARQDIPPSVAKDYPFLQKEVIQDLDAGRFVPADKAAAFGDRPVSRKAYTQGEPVEWEGHPGEYEWIGFEANNNVRIREVGTGRNELVPEVEVTPRRELCCDGRSPGHAKRTAANELPGRYGREDSYRL